MHHFEFAGSMLPTCAGSMLPTCAGSMLPTCVGSMLTAKVMANISIYSKYVADFSIYFQFYRIKVLDNVQNQWGTCWKPSYTLVIKYVGILPTKLDV